MPWSTDTGTDGTSRRLAVIHHSSFTKEVTTISTHSQPTIFAGIDWGSQSHQACVLASDGTVLGEKAFPHSGEGIGQMLDWMLGCAPCEAGHVATAIETPHGPVVDSLLERGFQVFSINPKQLDRFRDRFSPAGAKDDRRDARVLADAVRTDPDCLRALDPLDAEIVELREWSRMTDELTAERTRLTNRLRDQLWRYYPQFLELKADLSAPWVLALWKLAPTPTAARRVRPSSVAKLLKKHRIRRFKAEEVIQTLRAKAVTVAPGVVEAATSHIRYLAERLELVAKQISGAQCAIAAILERLSDSEEASSDSEEASSDSKKDPSDSEKDPSDSEKDPSDSEKDPSDSEKDPSDSEKDPSDSEKDPSDSEKDPSDSEKDPSDSEKDPSDSEKDPSDSEKDPSDSEKDPSDSEKDPSDSEKDPSDSEKDPSDSEKDPADSEEPPSGKPRTPRDAAILSSLPGVGHVVLATLLSEASGPIRSRDYQALRCLSGVAPVTRRSGKIWRVVRRRACQRRLVNAVYHWSRVAVQHDPISRAKYRALRERGHTHGRALRSVADRLLAVACAMLRDGTLFDSGRRTAAA